MSLDSLIAELQQQQMESEDSPIHSRRILRQSVQEHLDEAFDKGRHSSHYDNPFDRKLFARDYNAYKMGYLFGHKQRRKLGG